MSDILSDIDEDLPDASENLPSIEVELPDGSVEITFGDEDEANEPEDDEDRFLDNLAEDLDDLELKRISDELLDGIEADDASRQEWLEQRAYGIDLLGLDPRRKGGQDDDGNAAITHPLLLEAVLRCQANACGELLPVDGPVKVRDDGIQPGSEALADALETDLNHYLTAVATEFYPDTTRMLFWAPFGGSGFKKVYHCPLRGRPVSESVDAKDLIVSNDATDLQNAARVTQVITMRDATLRRMQLVRAYRDVELSGPDDEDDTNPVNDKLDEIGGSEGSHRDEDRQRTIYECYCELDIRGLEHKQGGEETGLALPYKVTIDKSSREVLEVRRNYDRPGEDEGEPLPIAKQVFVQYTFVPGIGFYGLGLLHILGNATKAATAAWRILIDAGMRANFPGGFIAKQAQRNDNINFRGAPGEFIGIETGGMPLDNVVSPYPFKGPDATTMALVQDIVQTAERVGGTAESNVGEGRQDAPVGTTLALLEAQRVILNAVHKRWHTSQATELKLIAERLKEAPEALFRNNPKPSIQWTAELVLQALEDHDLVPVSDPNTSSHLQRIATWQAVEQMAEKVPFKFDIDEVIKRGLQLMRVPNPEQLLSKNPSPMPPPDPIKAGELAVKQQLAQDKMLYDKAKIEIEHLKAQAQAASSGHGQPGPDPIDHLDAQTRQFAAQSKARIDQSRVMLEARAQQQQSQFDQAKLQFEQQIASLKHQLEMAKVAQADHHAPAQQAQLHLDAMDAHTRAVDAETRKTALAVKVHDNVIDAQQQAADRQSENQIAALNTFKELATHQGEMQDNEAERGHQAKENEAAREAQIEAAKLAAKAKPKSPQ